MKHSLFKRMEAFGLILSSVASYLPSFEKKDRQGAFCEVHTQPASVSNTKDWFATNPTVFGSILRGEKPSVPYAESDTLYAFADRTGKADFHALIIPKVRIPSIYSLYPTDNEDSTTLTKTQQQQKSRFDEYEKYKNDVDLLLDMKEMAKTILKENQPDAFAQEDYVLCFHIPPFYSVDHLHLHVMAPRSEMTNWARFIRYNPGSRWCIGVDEVINRLKNGELAVPYRRLF